MKSGEKRILCLIDSLASGGAQRQMVGLAGLLQKEGYEVKVVTYYDIPFYLTQLQDCGVAYEYVPYSTGLVKRLRNISRSIKLFNPSVVISYLDTPNILSCLIHFLHKKEWKLIVSERSTTQILSLRERIKFALYRFADAIVSNSFSQANFISKHYPQYDGKWHVITNFVDTDAFIPNANKTQNETFHIIGVGRITTAKNISILIEALKLVLEHEKKVKVDWYGNKFEAYPNCIKLINKYGLKDTFIFHEPCNDIISKYQNADLFVLSSIYEGFPNVLCEAMSCGLPVVATDVCDNGCIVRHDENGYLVPSGDAGKLADRLLQFIAMPLDQRVIMGEKSREISLELFSKEAFVKKYIKLFE